MRSNKDVRLLGAAMLVVALVAGACGGTTDPTPPPNIIINNGGDIINIIGGGPSASPSPGSVPAGCPSVLRVGIVAEFDGGQVTSWRVGDVPRLDITPKDATNAPVPSQCHGQIVTWSLSREGCKLQGDTQGFIPYVSCSSAGQLTVTGTVSPPGGTATAQFNVLS